MEAQSEGRRGSQLTLSNISTPLTTSTNESRWGVVTKTAAETRKSYRTNRVNKSVPPHGTPDSTSAMCQSDHRLAILPPVASPVKA